MLMLSNAKQLIWIKIIKAPLGSFTSSVLLLFSKKYILEEGMPHFFCIPGIRPLEDLIIFEIICSNNNIELAGL